MDCKGWSWYVSLIELMCQYPWIVWNKDFDYVTITNMKNSSDFLFERWAVAMSMNVVSVDLIIDRKYFYIFIKASGMNQTDSCCLLVTRGLYFVHVIMYVIVHAIWTFVSVCFNLM